MHSAKTITLSHRRARVRPQLELLEDRLSPAGGLLDLAFGTGHTGLVTTAFTGGTGQSFASAVQHDGRILLAGRVVGGGGDYFALARYTSDGTLDTTFGADHTGMVTTDFGGRVGGVYASDEAHSMAVQADGRILLAGSRTRGDNMEVADFALARYTSGGVLDTTFGSDHTGLVTTDFGAIDEATALAVQSDGSILVAGSTVTAGTPGFDFALARYTSAGGLDTAFGPASTGLVTTGFAGGYARANSLAVQPDGRILVSGEGYLARYTSGGALDSTFGINRDGKVTIDFPDTPRNFASKAIALQTDGRIALAGLSYSAPPTSDIIHTLARYTGDGVPDETFGAARTGRVDTGIAASNNFSALAVRPGGSILFAGGTPSGDFVLAQYTGVGVRDTTFGPDHEGLVTTDFGGFAYATSLAVQSDGKVIVAGYVSGGGFGMARYAAGSPIAWGDPGAPHAHTPAGLNNVASVAVGGHHALALRADGTVVGWGSNDSGQLDIPAGLGVVAIAAGDRFSLALRADGTVVGWGSNDSGQLDIPAGLGGVVAVAAGGRHALALRADGTVVGWGSNDSGQSSVPEGLGGVVAIAAGDRFSLALRADGTVVGWGSNDSGQLDIPAGLGGVVAVAAGGRHALALRADGTVAGWGNDDSGQIDVPAGLGHVVAIAAGGHHSLALRSDIGVVGWGNGGFGQASAPPGPNQVVALAAGEFVSLALIDPALPYTPWAQLVANFSTPSPSRTNPYSINGVWRYNDDPNVSPVGWSMLHPGEEARSVAMSNAEGATGDVVASFTNPGGPGTYLYQDSAGWTLLTSSVASLLDINDGNIVANFPGSGVWAYTAAAGWKSLGTGEAAQVAVDPHGGVVGEFPGWGVWRYTPSLGWQRLSAVDADHVAIAGRGYVAASFPGYGTFRYQDATGWVPLTTVAATSLAINDWGDVAASYQGYGTFRFEDDAGWASLTPSVASLLGITDVGNVAASFPGYGVWFLTRSTNHWAQLDSTDADSLAANN